MIEAYTDEEIVEARQPWLNLVEGFWDMKGGRIGNFYIQTPDGYLLIVYTDGEVDVRKSTREYNLCFVEKYAQLFSLEPNGTREYLAKTDKLKKHVIALIKDRNSHISFYRKDFNG